MIDHRRIDVPKSALALNLFADYYRYGRRNGRAERPPLVCCWGGALNVGQYEERRAARPARLLAEIAQILVDAPIWDVDVLFLPNPEIVPRSRPQLRRDLAHAFVDELLPRTLNPEPSALGFLGHSAGAYVVTCLALDLPASRAVAAVGGVGMTEALLETSDAIAANLQFAAFTNYDDPVADETSVFEAALGSRGRSLLVERGRGGHEIEDYLDNGLLVAAATWMRKVLDGAGRVG